MTMSDLSGQMQRRGGSERSCGGGGGGGSRRDTSSATPPPRRAPAPAGSARGSPLPQPVEFLVQGTQIGRTERADSLTPSQRRQSVDTPVLRRPPHSEDPQTFEELSLELSQESDFDDTSKCGLKRPPLRTSTPRHSPKPRRSSLQMSPRLCQSRGSAQSESRQSESRLSEVRRSESRLIESRRSESRLSESRLSQSRQSESRLSDFRRSESGQSESRQSESSLSEGRRSDSRQSESRISDFRRSESGQSESRQSESPLSEGRQREGRLSDFRRSESGPSKIRLREGQRIESGQSQSSQSDGRLSEFRRSLSGQNDSRHGQNDRRQSESRRSNQSRDSQGTLNSLDSCRTACSMDSPHQSASNASMYRMTGRSSEADNWSVSPEYSTQSSADVSPRSSGALPSDTGRARSPPRREHVASSSCIPPCQPELAEQEHAVGDAKLDEAKPSDGGEWSNFWVNYNNSTAQFPIKTFYDQCPTPYRSEYFFTDSGREGIAREPPNIDHINRIIQMEGLFLTPRETQSIIKCAHLLSSVLTKAIERRTKDIINEEGVKEVYERENEEKGHKNERFKEDNEDIGVTPLVSSKINRNISKIAIESDATEKEQTENMEKEQMRKHLRLELREQHQPMEEEKRSETKTTQTDISLPNTKSAPRIFEKILRQLSKSSIEVPSTKEEDPKKDADTKS